KVVSHKKDELNHILDQFNIQVDNPVSVLNQDTSRNFLNSSDPKDKYRFFLKATQLEQVSSDYELIIEQQAIIKNTLDKKQETLPAMQRQVLVLEEKYKDIAQLKTMKEQVEELKKERVWAEVIATEKQLGPLSKEEGDQKAKLPRYEERVKKCEVSGTLSVQSRRLFRLV
ncbi:PREDICTED: structural maintenance of chromosomes protein 6-like, partial [Acropora digitifera]|uniref:structural maintenance of chromosomes protein 6-like n=1 Tax=Acropora digitifera TaxID=70779 RepID=UPI00077AD0E0